MSGTESAAALLRLSRMDLDALIGMGDNPLFADAIFGFHVQQCIEKSLKSWLVLKGVNYPRTHDLRLLMRLLENAGAEISEFWHLMEYSIYSVQTRYEEGLLESDEPLDRALAKDEAAQLWAHVNQLFMAPAE
jgi:HEPN domain-containing protein